MEYFESLLAANCYFIGGDCHPVLIFSTGKGIDLFLSIE
jgi:hypothetical protein